MFCDPLVFPPIPGTGNRKSRFHGVERHWQGMAGIVATEMQEAGLQIVLEEVVR